MVIVRPEEYPETAVLENLADWFDGGKYVMIPAYTPETIILAPEQKEGLILIGDYSMQAKPRCARSSQEISLFAACLKTEPFVV